MRIDEVRISEIRQTKARRPINPEAVKKLAESIELIGLQNPITLRRCASGYPYLISGAHRLEAIKTLGRESIPAIYVDLDDLQAELAEIDENLLRDNLSAAREAIAIERRAELIMALEEKPGPNGPGLGKGGRGKTDKAPASERDLAEKTGKSKSSVRRAKKRTESLGTEALEKVDGTCLDKPGELDALAKMTEEDRSVIIDKARSGAKVSAKIELKKLMRDKREVKLAAKQTALPDKKYGVIVADPEWRFEPYSRETGMDRAADNHYPTSCTEVIAARDVPSIAADDCVLFLWATGPMLPDALEVMEAWGFEYRSQYVWGKDRIGTGYWNRNRHENLLIGVRGNVPAPAMGTQWGSLIIAPVGQHSAKPEEFLDMIEAYFPNLPKIELNRRGLPRANWDAWGNEIGENETL